MTSEVTTDPSPGALVRHEPALARYTVWLDNQPVGLADYVATGRDIRFTHTEVDPAHRGKGLAGILIEQALDDVRTRLCVPIVAECPYVAEWIDRNVEYQDLLTRGR
ncbi:MAG: hypothetical protein JWQ59_2306 [Cryobacterium sp.]|jgi:predicted GNAT family acetyltransferase|nr:hypothetical protein [Cryobacterium sp.]